MSGNLQTHTGPGLVRGAAQGQHFQGRRTGKRVSCLTESTHGRAIVHE